MNRGDLNKNISIVIIAIIMTCLLPGCEKQADKSDVQEQKAIMQKSPSSQPKGEWKFLSNDSNLEAWMMEKPDAWKAENGIMSKSEGGGNIWTKARYGNFVFDCDFKIETGGNSGIFFRTDNIKDPVQTGIEMQVYNTPRKQKPVKNDCGAIYDLLEPGSYADKPAGEWNHVTITCNDNIIKVVMNGIQIIATQITEEMITI